MIVNKTPHPIKIADADGAIVRIIEPTPPAARVTVSASTLLTCLVAFMLYLVLAVITGMAVGLWTLLSR